ncbi:FAD:protein FMN transferase [Micromonospora auratinigra]|uniref:FAD:protein FMN transferase n=1 Tax=Micromonospora auratinigra TaxID=261654 RepID=A0A1A8Z6T8_9ACTN|nr:FAD:protein FMN transferase [Micromonospora auratinigra]SBT39541.1 thiamine biosynthesis lipoprotein [Micromonospora auratinigra]
MAVDGCFEVRWWWRDRPVRVAVTDRAVLPAARRAVARRLAGLRAVDLELGRAHRAAGRPVPVGPLLRELLSVALGAAEASGGAVDPTVGAARLRRVVGAVPSCGSGWGRVTGGADWRAVSLRGDRLAVPPPHWLDLGATAGAYLVQRCAERVAARYGGGVLVAVGSRLAVAGQPPPDGWRVAQGPPTVRGGALVTADLLRPDAGGVRDPRTGGEPAGPWSAVTVAAPDAARAAMLAVGALARGADGPGWLAAQGVRAWPRTRPATLPQTATRW